MNLRKKIVAVAAMAAVCCTLNVPVMAGAGTDGQQRAEPTTCPPHDMVRDEGEYVAKRRATHTYIKQDGTEDICSIVEEYLLHNMIYCTKCGISRIDQYEEYLGIRHTRCGR